MPLLEGVCQSETCRAFGYKQEHFYHHVDVQELNRCDFCGGPTARAISTFNVVFTGAITARYNDRNLENSHEEGHTVWGRDKDGKAFSKRIETWQDQKEWCREQGLANPKDHGKNMSVAEDGKAVLSPMGLPGVEL